MDDLTREAREPLDDARKLLSVPVEEWTRESAEIAEGIVAAYVDNVPALLARLEAAEAKLGQVEALRAEWVDARSAATINAPGSWDRLAKAEADLAALQGEG